MNEQEKIKEARYFLGLLRDFQNDREKFIYNLSAYLHAGRSPLQYACKEARQKSGGQAWYDNQVTGNRVVSFLKDERDLNVHVKPVSPNAGVDLRATDNMSISESVLIATIRADGTLERREVSSPGSTALNLSDLTLTLRYFFPDWSGNEDVITLCEIYLQEVERIVADGVSKGFMTP